MGGEIPGLAPAQGSDLSDGLRKFVAAGAPPVLFTLGSEDGLTSACNRIEAVIS
jgi:hypothetical protein